MPINNALTPEGQNALGAAFGYYPQLRRNRTLQDPRLAAEMPLQFARGRVAATAGAIPDILNLVRTPMPMEMYGDVDYGPQTQVPYGSQELLRTLPLPPQGAAQQAAANVGAVVPLTPMEALQAARAARQAAFAGGRALGPTAARMTEGYLQRQGLIMPLDVYHGTPHTLPPTARNPLGEFDASKIGTGEGAQAYGFGIYTAETPATAIEYQKKLSSTGLAKHLANQYGGVDEGLAEAKRRVESYKQLIADGGGGAMSRAKSMLQISEKNVKDLEAVKAGLPENTGSLYKVDLPDAMIPKMLDWDKPLNKQKPVMLAIRTEAEQRVRNQLLGDIENNIRASLPKTEIGNDYMAMFSNENVAQNQAVKNQALAKLNKMDLSSLIEKEMQSMKPVDATWEMTGKDFYEMLSKQTGSAKQAAKMLKNQGVLGIKYLDEASRIKGEGTRNFVTFPGEEKNLRILERNGQPVNALAKNK